MAVIRNLIVLSIVAYSISGCFMLRNTSEKEKSSRKAIKRLPESEIVFYAAYEGTQTGTVVYFRRDSVFVIRATSAFGRSDYYGTYKTVSEKPQTYSLTYLNDHYLPWNYAVIDSKSAFLSATPDSTDRQSKTFIVRKNILP